MGGPPIIMVFIYNDVCMHGSHVLIMNSRLGIIKNFTDMFMAFVWTLTPYIWFMQRSPACTQWNDHLQSVLESTNSCTIRFYHDFCFAFFCFCTSSCIPLCPISFRAAAKRSYVGVPLLPRTLSWRRSHAFTISESMSSLLFTTVSSVSTYRPNASPSYFNWLVFISLRYIATSKWSFNAVYSIWQYQWKFNSYLIVFWEVKYLLNSLVRFISMSMIINKHSR